MRIQRIKAPRGSRRSRGRGGGTEAEHLPKTSRKGVQNALMLTVGAPLGGLSMQGEVTVHPFMTQIAQIQVPVRF